MMSFYRSALFALTFALGSISMLPMFITPSFAAATNVAPSAPERVFLPAVYTTGASDTPTPPAPATPTSADATIYAADQFSRTVTDHWGDAATGGAYSLSGSATNFDVHGVAGTMVLSAAGQMQKASLASVSALDVDSRVRLHTDKLATGGTQFAYLVARQVSGNAEYRGQLRFSSDRSLRLRASRVTGGTETLLGDDVVVANMLHAPNTYVWLRMHVAGTNPTTIRLKAWADGQAEPATWQYVITDKEAVLQAQGAVGVQAYLSSSASNAPVRVTFDDFRVTSVSAPIDTTGGVTLRDTNYAIPSGARFVAPTGNDSHAGTQAAPWRTLRHAITAAPAGATVVLRGGTYREGNISLGGKRLTLQPYPHEQVWLKGSVVVTGWVQDGTLWRKDGWTYQFRRGLPADFIDPAYPLAAHPDMVFINGAPLKQVGSKTHVKPGTFFVDYSTKKLYIGDNPGGKTVEGAAHAQALQIVNAAGTVVRGLGFQHYATHRDEYGAVHGNTPRLVFEHNTFAYNAAQGLSILESDAVVRGNLFVYNGQLGLHAHQAHRLLVEGNRMAYNNNEYFRWEAGGAKLARSRDLVIRDNVFEHNVRQGLWHDVSCYNVTIVRNVARNNTGSGIMYEISAKALIASNVVTENGQFGIYVSESGDVDVYNNTLARNGTNLRVFEGRHTSSDPLISRDVRDVVVRNNLMSNTTSTSRTGLFSVDDVQNLKTAEQMGVSADYNAYYRTSASVPSTAVQWSRGASDVTNFTSFHAFRAGTTQERNGLGIDNAATNPFFVDEGAGNYRLTADSIARGKGTPLPSAIANAIGVPAGVPVDLGALRW